MIELPVVSAENIVGTLEKMGVTKWKKIDGPTPLDEYLKRELTPKEKGELRFAPKIEMMQFENPRKEIFTGFRTRGKNGVAVLSLLPGDLIPVCGEFRHGCETISLNLPGGTFEKETPTEAAKREFEEETGIMLEDVIPLSTQGMPTDARTNANRFLSFIGVPRNPIVIKDQNLDHEEFVKTVLVPINEWLKLIEEEKVQDSYSVVTTFLALRKLGRL